MFEGITQRGWWQTELVFNTVGDYVVAILSVAVFFAIFYVVQRFLLWRLKKWAKWTENDVDNVLVDIVASFRPPFYAVVAIYLATRTLDFTPFIRKGIDAVFVVMVVYQVVRSVQALIDYVVHKKSEATEEGQDKAVLTIINTFAKLGLWILGLLFVLSNLGIDITSLLTGLGIGGIAVALAAQNVLGDLFSSLAIYFDKPFAVGDFIIVGDYMGTVKHVGMKTTRLKSIGGEEIIIPNKELTGDRVRNYKRMTERRIAFELGVTYGTATEQLRKIPQLIEEAVAAAEQTRFGRAHFHEFGDSALLFEVVFFVTSKDYDEYMDARQVINLRIKELFEGEDIEMAFPTRTVHVHAES